MNRKPSPRLATVIRTRRVTPNMQRVTFGGNALLGFPTDRASANVKLLLPHDGQPWDAYVASLGGEGEKPVKRTYTVLEYREAENELDIEFALHEASGPGPGQQPGTSSGPGPATRWALAAKEGDRIGIAGPGPAKLVDVTADWFLLAADMSALPALVANVRALPANAKGHVVVEVHDPDDRIELDAPPGMRVRWIVSTGDPSLVQTVKALDWPEGTPALWMAGESGCARELRSWFAREKRVDRSNRYTSGYWQVGHDEDSHQLVKRSEPEI